MGWVICRYRPEDLLFEGEVESVGASGGWVGKSLSLLLVRWYVPLFLVGWRFGLVTGGMVGGQLHDESRNWGVVVVSYQGGFLKETGHVEGMGGGLQGKG